MKKKHKKLAKPPRPSRPRHTEESLNKMVQLRAKLTAGELRRRLRDGEYVGFPNLSLNRRVAVVADGDNEPFVVIWVKRTMEILTLYNFSWYLSRNEISERYVAAVRAKFGGEERG